jgi:serine/threonine protein phosphatase PrpC
LAENLTQSSKFDHANSALNNICDLVHAFLILKIVKCTAFPEVQQFSITEDWEFVVLACDGIWDVMSNEEVIEFVRIRLGQIKLADEESHQNFTIHPEEICEELLNHCLAPDALMGTGCDNMTVILVCFLHGKPCSELVMRCQNPPSRIDQSSL